MREKTARIPIYKRIQDELTREIEQLDLPANSPFLTEVQAIERFKVSRMTIRQAFEELEQAGYIYRVQGKGSFIGPHGATPTKTVAFIATCILNNGIESVLLRAVEDYLDKSNYNLIICNTNNKLSRTENYIKRLIRSKIDAVIYISVLGDSNEAYDENAELIDFIRNQDIPILLLDRYVRDALGKVFCITPDNYRAAYAMTEHLISLGHTRIGVCQGKHSSSIDDRIAGYKQCIEDHGLEFRPEFHKKIMSDDECKVVAMQYHMMKEGPTAIFALWDDLAYHLIEAFQDFDINVPEDIAVVGFDNYSGVKTSRTVQLTTMNVPLWEEGKLAASIIVDLLQGRDITPTHVKIPCELVIRETCGIKHVGKKMTIMSGHQGNTDEQR